MVEIDRYIRNWKEAGKIITHKTIEEWPIFIKAKIGVDRPGAVMQHVKKFSRAILKEKTSSENSTHSIEQEIFFVVNGKGKIETEYRYENLYEGSAVLVPPNVQHILVNESNKPLELLIITENTLPESRNLRRNILIRNYHDLPINKMDNGEFFHWCHKPRVIFSPEDGLSRLHYVIFVSMDAKKVAEPHKHPEGTDEVFYQLKGETFMVLGEEGRIQRPGVAIMIPPDNKTNHASITFDKPASWFYFAHHANF